MTDLERLIARAREPQNDFERLAKAQRDSFKMPEASEATRAYQTEVARIEDETIRIHRLKGWLL